MRKFKLILETSVEDLNEVVQVATSPKGEAFHDLIESVRVSATHPGGGRPSYGQVDLISESGFRVMLDTATGQPASTSAPVSKELLEAARTAYRLAGLENEED